MKIESVRMFAEPLKRAARAVVFCATLLLGPFSGGDFTAHGRGHGGSGHGSSAQSGGGQGESTGHGGSGQTSGAHSGSGHGGSGQSGGHFGEDHVFGHGDFGRGLADHHADIQRGHFFFRHHPISTGFSAPSPTPTKS